MDLAREEDLSLLIPLYQYFITAIGDKKPSEEDASERILELMAMKSLYLLEADIGEGIRTRGVSMCAVIRESKSTKGIGIVATEPRFGGRGFATRLVATVTQAILDSGKRYATLFTDLTNPHSNYIYKKIGYQPHTQVGHYVMNDEAQE